MTTQEPGGMSNDDTNVDQAAFCDMPARLLAKTGSSVPDPIAAAAIESINFFGCELATIPRNTGQLWVAA
jgi:hypothetical protein